MKRIRFSAVAAGVALLATLVAVGVASAHAPIKVITWDSDTNPTSLTASTDNRTMETTPGSFYLRVYNAGGARVDNGDAKVSADQLSIKATLQANLPVGSYRVDWLTTSTDGEVISGSASVPLPGSFTSTAPEEEDTAPATATPPTTSYIAPPSTGDAGLLDRDSGDLAGTGVLAVGIVTILAACGLVFAHRRPH